MRHPAVFNANLHGRLESFFEEAIFRDRGEETLNPVPVVSSRRFLNDSQIHLSSGACLMLLRPSDGLYGSTATLLARGDAEKTTTVTAKEAMIECTSRRSPGCSAFAPIVFPGMNPGHDVCLASLAQPLGELRADWPPTGQLSRAATTCVFQLHSRPGHHRTVREVFVEWPARGHAGHRSLSRQAVPSAGLVCKALRCNPRWMPTPS